MKTKVHRIVLMVVDHDDIGAEEVREVLENARYPNHCISPGVMSVDTLEVNWTDSHPLNISNKKNAEFDRIFGAEKSIKSALSRVRK